MNMVLSNQSPSAPYVTTGSQSGAAGLWQAAIPGLSNSQSQQAVQAQLAVMAKKSANRRYVSESYRKLAPALTNGQPTQAYANGQPLTFNITQMNNAYCRGIIVRTTLAYTLAAGTSAVYGRTAAGSLGIYDTIEVKYNRSQIKFRPLWLRQLALAGAIEWNSIPSIGGSGNGGQQDDTAYVDAYLSPTMPVVVGANTYVQDIFIPFALLSPFEDRGLLPAMPGETGIQVVLNCSASLFGTDPVYNSIYLVSGSGGAISAVSGTCKVVGIYQDGEVFNQTQALSYDMSILKGTIQVQQDSPLTALVTGTAQHNSAGLTIIGQHHYVGLLVVDFNQSNNFALSTNINYLEIAKDGVGANTFQRWGQGTNLDMQDWYWAARMRHRNNDLDQGVFFLIEGPLTGQSSWGDGGANDGTQFLDNSTSGWPAWHYGVGLGTINGLGAPNASRIEPLCVYVNPVGLPPV